MFRFVSLGCDCQPVFQINKLQGQGATHFFDCIGSTLDGLIGLLDDDFRGLMTADSLVPYYIDNRLYAVLDKHRGLDFTHDFARLDQQSIMRAAKIYALRTRWFLELFDEDSPPTYFVRRADLRDPDHGDDRALALLDRLKSRRKDVRLLYLHEDRQRPPGFAPGYRSSFLPQREEFFWHGLDSAWTFALNRTAVMPYGDDGPAFPLPLQKPPRFIAA